LQSRAEYIKETLARLDRYLGPVRRSGNKVFTEGMILIGKQPKEKATQRYLLDYLVMTLSNYI